MFKKVIILYICFFSINAVWANTVGLVNCNEPRFQLANSVTSMMSWSDHEYKQLNRASHPEAIARHCEKLLDFRGSSYCKEPTNETIQTALTEALNKCITKARKDSSPKSDHTKKAVKTETVPSLTSKTQQSEFKEDLIIDCNKPEYQQSTSKTGLVSWAKREVSHIENMVGTGNHNEHLCKTAMGYQGSAYCKNPSDINVAKDLKRIVSMCEESRNPKGKPFLDCQKYQHEATYQTLMTWVADSMGKINVAKETTLDPTCNQIMGLAGAAHCKLPAKKEPRIMIKEIGIRCQNRFKAIQVEKKEAILAQQMRMEEIKKNRKITNFPTSTYNGKDAEIVEKQIRQAMLANREVAKSNNQMLKVQPMGEWYSGIFLDSKVPYRKLMATILWHDDDNDGICNYTSYNFIQAARPNGGYNPLRFKSFCMGCPEGWTKCN